MRLSLTTLLISSLLVACVDKSVNGAANNAPANDVSLATWNDLIGTWDASSATTDESDTLYVIMQANGETDYLNYNANNVCYEKTSLVLIDQGEGAFKHETSSITLTFTLNADKNSAIVSNNIDTNSYVITKDNKTAQQLTPICNQTQVEPPADEAFTDATMNDLVVGNTIWNSSKAISDSVTDISYIVFTKENDGYDDISFYDYKNDGVDGASSDCYERLSSTIKDRGEGIFSNWLNANKLHIQVNETGDLLYATYVANNKSLLLTKEGVNNLTTADFNACP